MRLASGNTKPVKMTPALVRELLGVPKFRSDEALSRDEVGAATGLAWTAVGGDVLIVEARAVKGKGRLQLTGQLGDVMKESAQAALTLLRSRARGAGHRGRASSRRTTSTSTSPKGRSRRTDPRPASRCSRPWSPPSPGRRCGATSR